MYDTKRFFHQTVVFGAFCFFTIASVSLSACVFEDTKTHACANGFRCPADMRCALNQDTCIEGKCGDGVVDYDDGESCDDGNILDGDGCSSDCKSLERCGNNNLDEGEVCDDGNRVNGDGCNSTCISDESCGNGFRDEHEICDDGNTADGDSCSAKCDWLETCGNGNLDPNEICDDGNNKSDDGCSGDCRSTEVCKNRYTDISEECDEGRDDAICDGDCTVPFCGDGYTNPMFEVEDGTVEQCDEGNPNTPPSPPPDTATCDSDCTRPRCGDGHHNPEFIVTTSDSDEPPEDGEEDEKIEEYAEECDDGNESNDDACVDRCKAARCGDGYTHEGKETCDDGNDDTSDDCPSGPDGTCEPARCGDGLIKSNNPNREACDDGNGENDDDCPDGPDGTCEPAFCGDGHVYSELNSEGKPHEECDEGGEDGEEGNGNSNDPNAKCRLNCKFPSCGDLVIDDELGEVCDDGNKNTNDDCPDGPDGTCETATCGDGHLYQGNNPGIDPETCDAGDDNSDAPNASCRLDCQPQRCGDDIRDNDLGEICDGASGCSANQTCTLDCSACIDNSSVR